MLLYQSAQLMQKRVKQKLAFIGRALGAGCLLTMSVITSISAADPPVRIQELPIPQVQKAPNASPSTQSSTQPSTVGGRPSIPGSEFEFARLQYAGGFEWPRWRADWPDAEYHFSRGLKRLTRIDVSTNSRVITLDDPNLFEYPWLYVVEVGYWWPSTKQQQNLREYLLRGGFLMVDDFHGSREWTHFISVMRGVFPDRRVVALQQGAGMFSVHYDITKRQQIPGIRSVMNNRTWEKGGVKPGWFGILDDHGRVMMAINFNQDIGDAWEHADDAIYPEPFTALAYRMGVNYVIYAMTH